MRNCKQLTNIPLLWSLWNCSVPVSYKHFAPAALFQTGNLLA